jgi:hypothetical protein
MKRSKFTKKEFIAPITIKEAAENALGALLPNPFPRTDLPVIPRASGGEYGDEMPWTWLNSVMKRRGDGMRRSGITGVIAQSIWPSVRWLFVFQIFLVFIIAMIIGIPFILIHIGYEWLRDKLRR